MQSKCIHDRIEEFRKVRADAGNDDAALLEVALFLEDVFGLRLSDDEICEKNLGTHQATEQFLLNKCDTR